MYTYLFEGVVIPERAQLSIHTSLQFTPFLNNEECIANISIILNKVVVWVDSPIEWQILDLRNVVRKILQDELAIIGYLTGHAYEVEVTRVLNRELGIDCVFGIEIGCIVERNKGIDIGARILEIKQKTHGVDGVFLTRCFNDLIAAMKTPDDTAFYCYRALESLRQLCVRKYGLNPKNKLEHWARLREVAQCSEESTRFIKESADPLRHGDVAVVTDEGRAKLFMLTWEIVDNFLSRM